MIQPTLEVLDRLVGYPTVSTDSNLELIDYAATLLEAVGARITRTFDDAGNKANLFASIGPDVDGGVILSGHTDVVPTEGQDWTRDPFRLTIEGDRAYGRGTTDMKGFLACALAMAPVFADAGLATPVHLAMTFDEEEGCHGAKVLLDTLAQTGPKPAVAIIGEPTRHGIVVANKGCFEFTTEIRGVERHASMSAAGAGAIHAAARFIAMLDGLAEQLAARAPADSMFDPPGTTINVGTIQGGVARNITAGSAVLDWEFRPIDPADRDFILAEVERFVSEELLPSMREEFPEAEVVTTTVGAVGGFRPDPDGPATRLARILTGEETLGAVAFGTEAGLFQEAGISPVVCGPGDIEQAHKPDEFIELSELDRCLSLMNRLIAELT